MGLLRAFIAIEIPLEIRQTIHRETSDFRNGMDSLHPLGAAGKYAPDLEVPRRYFSGQCGDVESDDARRSGILFRF